MSKIGTLMSLDIARAVFLLLALLFGFSTRVFADGDTSSLEIRGFRVDLQLASERDRKELLPSLERQLDIVEAANLPADVLAFFRTVPIVADPTLKPMNGEYTQQNGMWFVRMRAAKLPRDRAILLHELLHAYHHQVLKQPTPPIGRAYQQAVRTDMYPKKYRDEYFLTNAKEYFAVLGEIYLLGKVDRPPFDCSIPLKAQPEFIAYLGEHLGPGKCRK
jgi:hypothetical protein